MKRLFKIGFLSLLLIASQARATFLTGNVSFDDVTDLYTYTYTLDTTRFEGNISAFYIWQNESTYSPDPYPISHTEAAGYEFAVFGGGGGDLGDQYGSFWGWLETPLGGHNPYQGIRTFSFTTGRGVNTSGNNNYGVWNEYSPNVPPQYVEIGFIVGPALINTPYVPPSPVPENETYAMMIAGLGVLGFIGRRTKRKTSNKHRMSAMA